jgi:hypothetical protein
MIGLTRHIDAFILNSFAGQKNGRNQVELIDYDEIRSVKLIAGKIGVKLELYTPFLVTDTRLKEVDRNFIADNKDIIVFIHDNLDICNECLGINFCDRRTLEVWNLLKDTVNIVGRFRLHMPSRDFEFRGEMFEPNDATLTEDADSATLGAGLLPCPC